MTKKLNGTAKWIGLIIVLVTVVFNAGVTYNHLHHLSKDIEDIKKNYTALDEKFDKMMIMLAGSP